MFNMPTSKKFLIGMIHLPPLAGYPNYPGITAVISHALHDLLALEKAGFDAVLIENDNDQPHAIQVSAAVLDCFEKVAKKVIKDASIPVGIEVLYDMSATLKLAHKVGASFVRFDVFSDDMVTKWGKVIAKGKSLVASNTSMGEHKPLIFADVHVKHATLAKQKSLTGSMQDTDLIGSDAMILTGTWTGKPPDIHDLLCAKAATLKPIIIGSGLKHTNAKLLLPYAQGAIVGSSIKTNGVIDLDKACKLVKAVNTLNNNPQNYGRL